MSWDLALRHCAATRATIDTTRVSLELLSAQLAGLEAYVKVQAERDAAPTARIALPEHCAGFAEDQCGLRNEEAQRSKASLSNPNRWMCSGCRAESVDGVTI